MRKFVLFLAILLALSILVNAYSGSGRNSESATIDAASVGNP